MAYLNRLLATSQDKQLSTSVSPDISISANLSHLQRKVMRLLGATSDEEARVLLQDEEKLLASFKQLLHSRGKDQWYRYTLDVLEILPLTEAFRIKVRDLFSKSGDMVEKNALHKDYIISSMAMGNTNYTDNVPLQALYTNLDAKTVPMFSEFVISLPDSKRQLVTLDEKDTTVLRYLRVHHKQRLAQMRKKAKQDLTLEPALEKLEVALDALPQKLFWAWYKKYPDFLQKVWEKVSGWPFVLSEAKRLWMQSNYASLLNNIVPQGYSREELFAVGLEYPEIAQHFASIMPKEQEFEGVEVDLFHYQRRGRDVTSIRDAMRRSEVQTILEEAVLQISDISTLQDTILGVLHNLRQALRNSSSEGENVTDIFSMLDIMHLALDTPKKPVAAQTVVQGKIDSSSRIARDNSSTIERAESEETMHIDNDPKILLQRFLLRFLEHREEMFPREILSVSGGAHELLHAYTSLENPPEAYITTHSTDPELLHKSRLELLNEKGEQAVASHTDLTQEESSASLGALLDDSKQFDLLAHFDLESFDKMPKALRVPSIQIFLNDLHTHVKQDGVLALGLPRSLSDMAHTFLQLHGWTVLYHAPAFRIKEDYKKQLLSLLTEAGVAHPKRALSFIRRRLEAMPGMIILQKKGKPAVTYETDLLDVESLLVPKSASIKKEKVLRVSERETLNDTDMQDYMRVLLQETNNPDLVKKILFIWKKLNWPDYDRALIDALFKWPVVDMKAFYLLPIVEEVIMLDSMRHLLPLELLLHDDENIRLWMEMVVLEHRAYFETVDPENWEVLERLLEVLDSATSEDIVPELSQDESTEEMLAENITEEVVEGEEESETVSGTDQEESLEQETAEEATELPAEHEQENTLSEVSPANKEIALEEITSEKDRVQLQVQSMVDYLIKYWKKGEDKDALVKKIVHMSSDPAVRMRTVFQLSVLSENTVAHGILGEFFKQLHETPSLRQALSGGIPHYEWMLFVLDDFFQLSAGTIDNIFANGRMQRYEQFGGMEENVKTWFKEYPDMPTCIKTIFLKLVLVRRIKETYKPDARGMKEVLIELQVRDSILTFIDEFADSKDTFECIWLIIAELALVGISILMDLYLQTRSPLSDEQLEVLDKIALSIARDPDHPFVSPLALKKLPNLQRYAQKVAMSARTDHDMDILIKKVDPNFVTQRSFKIKEKTTRRPFHPDNEIARGFFRRALLSHPSGSDTLRTMLLTPQVLNGVPKEKAEIWKEKVLEYVGLQMSEIDVLLFTDMGQRMLKNQMELFTKSRYEIKNATFSGDIPKETLVYMGGVMTEHQWLQSAMPALEKQIVAALVPLLDNPEWKYAHGIIIQILAALSPKQEFEKLIITHKSKVPLKYVLTYIYDRNIIVTDELEVWLQSVLPKTNEELVTLFKSFAPDGKKWKQAISRNLPLTKILNAQVLATTPEKEERMPISQMEVWLEYAHLMQTCIIGVNSRPELDRIMGIVNIESALCSKYSGEDALKLHSWLDNNTQKNKNIIKKRLKVDNAQLHTIIKTVGKRFNLLD